MTSSPPLPKLSFKATDIQIPFTKYILSNGLRLIVHEDFKAPIAAVNVWYHVGSKNEKHGKSGFAHLFEHLMFNGSENFNTDYFQALEAIGATDMNGTTNNDRTNYFQNVPIGALEQVLWLESDRMGHLTGAIDQAKLDEQRGVVINEKKQGENQPYSKEEDLFTEAMFPKGHPYSWTVIGSMEDLNGASVDDVHEWFKHYYGAANAVIVIAGAIKAEEALEKVKKYFGHIPCGPTIARYNINIPIRLGHSRQEYEDHVPEAKVSIAWNVPQWGTKEAAHLDLIAAVLSSGKTSRLYKKLIYDQHLATSVTAVNYSREIAGNFFIECKVQSGHQPDEIETCIKNILSEFLKTGPLEDELIKVKAQYFAGFIKGVERIGGFGGKSDVLAESEIFGERPDFYQTYNEYLEQATVADLKQTANIWLSDGSHTVIAKPFPTYATEPSSVDRSKLPELLATPPSSFPAIQKAKLSNGLEVILAQRKDSPTVVLGLMMNGGFSTDKLTGKPGLASIAMNMLDEGTHHLNALEISEHLSLLGASIQSMNDMDKSYLTLNTLKQSLEASLDIYSDILLHPSFPVADFERIKSLQIAGIQREKTNPIHMALRVMPKFLYGDSHPYSQPLSGSGFEESVFTITLEDVRQFYVNWIQPQGATLTIVGDLDMEYLLPLLEKKIGSWQSGPRLNSSIPPPQDQRGGILYLMHKPEIQQSVLMAGYTIDPYGQISEIAKEPLMNVLGGDFTSRINLNLREDKHWTYGAGVFVRDTIGSRPFITYTQVQIDKTKESIEEIIKEFNWISGEKPITSEEFEKTKNNQIMALPGIWETNAAVYSSLNELIKFGLPDDYWQHYSANVRALDLDQVRQLTNQLISSDKLKWFIVSNQEVVLPSLKELGFAQIILVDADGNQIEQLA